MKIRFIDQISQLSDQSWQQLNNHDNNHFIGKAFWQALEDSGAAPEQGGWQRHQP